MADEKKHTVHSVGEKLETVAGRVEEIYAKVEAENEKVLLFLTRKHISAIAGFALIVAAMYVGARLF